MRRILGEDHPDTLRSAHSFAATLRGLGQHKHAHQLGKDTLIRRRQVLGKDHPDTLRSATNLAATLHDLGQQEVGRQLTEDTLTRMRRVLGNDHPHTLRATTTLPPAGHRHAREAVRDRADAPAASQPRSGMSKRNRTQRYRPGKHRADRPDVGLHLPCRQSLARSPRAGASDKSLRRRKGVQPPDTCSWSTTTAAAQIDRPPQQEL
jgi:Tetratricopeptide repeat